MWMSSRPGERLLVGIGGGWGGDRGWGVLVSWYDEYRLGGGGGG